MKKNSVFYLITSLILAALAAAVFFSKPLKSMASLKKIDGQPFYSMRYYGDYGFDHILEYGVEQAGNPQPTQTGSYPQWACTVFAALGDSQERLLGRNFDWHDHPMLLLFMDPPGAYASVSMVDIAYLGYEEEIPFFQREALLDAPLLPFDGMNEHGLAVGMMAVPHTGYARDPGKVTIDSLHAIRLMLDHARTVEEAVELLGSYNIEWGGGPSLHYLVADASGHSVIVEYMPDGMNVIPNDTSWQTATNFLLSGMQPEDGKGYCRRYEQTYEALENAGGSLSQEEAMALLESASQPSTIWSVVYGMTDGHIQVAVGGDYSQIYQFNLR